MPPYKDEYRRETLIGGEESDPDPEERNVGGDEWRSWGRLVIKFLMCGLLFFGCYHAIAVFSAVGGVIKDPATWDEGVTAMGVLIGADALSFASSGSEQVQIGRLAATGVFFLLHFFWAWIPLKIISVAGRLLLAKDETTT